MTANRTHAAIACALLLPVLAACQRDRADAAHPDASAPAPVADAAFTAAQAQWRADRLVRLTTPDGWTSLVGLHWIDPGPHYAGSAKDNGIRLAVGPAQMGLFDLRNNAVRLVPAKGAALTLDDAPLRGPTVLRSDADENGPSRIGFDDGKGIATVIERGGRMALRVKHADAPTRTGFAGLDYWPADPAWSVQARFVPHPPGKTIPIADIIGTLNDVPNPGAVEFTRDGKTWRLEVLDEGEDTLFLVFADATNGHGSYGAGRFLDVPRPAADGRLQIDFNHAYNPPCAFTDFATCPLPPPENRLALKVTAGEKAYAKGAH